MDFKEQTLCTVHSTVPLALPLIRRTQLFWREKSARKSNCRSILQPTLFGNPQISGNFLPETGGYPPPATIWLPISEEQKNQEIHLKRNHDR